MNVATETNTTNTKTFITECSHVIVLQVAFLDNLKIVDIDLVVSNVVSWKGKVSKDIIELAKKYPKIIHVLKCAAQGAGAARNYAVTKSNAKYFWFVDAVFHVFVFFKKQ